MNRFFRSRGFSVVEVLTVVAVLGIVGSLAYTSLGKMHRKTVEEKLRSDVKTLNRAVNIYVSNGGDLQSAEDSEAVLERLKTRRDLATSERYVGLTSEMVDVRIRANYQSEAEAATDQLRAVWDAAKGQFVVKDNGGVGINQFILDEGYAEKLAEFESRDNGSFMFAEEDSWVWDYEDREKHAVAQPTTVRLFTPPSPGSGSPSGTPSVPPTTDPVPDPAGPIALAPPEISPGSGVYGSADYPLLITIDQTNPTGAAVIRYAIDEGSYQTYGSPFSLPNGATVRAYCGSNDPARYTPSENVEAVYEMDRWNGNPQNLFAYGMYSTIQIHLASINQMNVTGGVRSETSKIKIGGSILNIEGNMEASQKIELSDLSGVINGDLSAGEPVRGNQLVTHNGSVNIGSIGSKQLYVLPAPTGPDDPNYAHPITIIDGDYAIEGPLALNGTLYVTGSITVRGSQSITGSGALVANGQIHISGANTTVGEGAGGLFFYSLESQIHIADSDGLTVNGVCYAPNAQIHFSNVGDVAINGGVYCGGQIHFSDLNTLTVKPGIGFQSAVPPGIVAFVTDGP